jgi:adenylosuccinate synthase
MPTVCVVGAQWGDEGKAGIVDLLSDRADWVVRFQGGPNAGHTVVAGGETFKLHLLPSGMVRPEPRCLIGQGVVVDLATLFTELDMLSGRGIPTEGRLMVSDRAHLILPYHRILDGLRETGEGMKIGTTLKGIGPCYADKVSYRGIRVGELLDPAGFAERLRDELSLKNRILTMVYGDEPLDFDEVLASYDAFRDRLAPLVGDGSGALLDALDAGETVLMEGAQALLLDVDAGTYPFVTGSNASPLGIAAGAGIPPRCVEGVIAVAKAYCTRVGEGPFPTEDHGPEGEEMQRRGNEFGTTTGRPRRCGWFDAVAVRHGARMTGYDELAVTKLDIMTGVASLKLCIAYDLDGRRITHFPASARELSRATPVYEEFPGFDEEISDARAFEDLPGNARAYIEALEETVGIPIRIVSVGPDRDQVIRRG